MRILAWIVQTLLKRSWLIFGGIALGLLARTVWPVQPVDPGKLYPEARERFQELDDFGKQRSIIDQLGDTELSSS